MRRFCSHCRIMELGQGPLIPMGMSGMTVMTMVLLLVMVTMVIMVMPPAVAVAVMLLPPATEFGDFAGASPAEVGDGKRRDGWN